MFFFLAKLEKYFQKNSGAVNPFAQIDFGATSGNNSGGVSEFGTFGTNGNNNSSASSTINNLQEPPLF